MTHSHISAQTHKHFMCNLFDLFTVVSGHVCPYLVWLTKERVASTTLVDHVSNQVFLSIIGGEDADAVSRVAQETHVHVQSHSILCLCQVLHSKKEKEELMLNLLYVRSHHNANLTGVCRFFLVTVFVLFSLVTCVQTAQIQNSKNLMGGKYKNVIYYV